MNLKNEMSLHCLENEKNIFTSQFPSNVDVDTSWIKASLRPMQPVKKFIFRSFRMKNFQCSYINVEPAVVLFANVSNLI